MIDKIKINSAIKNLNYRIIYLNKGLITTRLPICVIELFIKCIVNDIEVHLLSGKCLNIEDIICLNISRSFRLVECSNKNLLVEIINEWVKENKLI